MNRTDRRQQLAFLLRCALVGALVGGYSGETGAQAAAPLRVDPVLLGAPPAVSEPAPAATPQPPSLSEPKDSAEVRPAGRDGAEVQPAVPVEASEVPAEAADEAPEPLEDAARMAMPAEQSAPERDVGIPAFSSAEDEKPDGTLLTPPGSPGEASGAPTEAPARVYPAAPIPSPRSSTPRTTALETLRVDPALLGAPPSVPAARLAHGSEAAGPAARAPSGTERPLSSGALPPAGEDDEKRAAARGEEEAADPGPALALRAASEMASLSGENSEPGPVFLSALRMAGEINREFVAEGEAELRKAGSVVNSDLMTYWPLEDEVEAEGRVRLQQREDVVTGPKLRLRLEDQIGYFEQPAYQLKHQSLLGGRKAADREESARRIEKLANDSMWNSGLATPQAMKFVPGQTRFRDDIALSTTTESRGEAERIDFEGENQYRLLNNTFTTCPVDNDAWYVRTSELKLDYDREVGEGRDASVYFMDMPILYSPWLSFSLNNQRKSGFLSPSFGTNSDNGFEYQQPYYWNIAPNMDATISPRLMTKRGVQFGSEFRYLNSALGGVYRGQMKAEYLPGDRLRDGGNRHAFSLTHDQTTGNGFVGMINFSKVSDDDYYTDLSSDITRSSQTQLLQQGMLTYGGGWWSASVNFQQYQTLQPDKNNPVLEQYRMLPQVTFNVRKPDFHAADIDFLGQYTHFTVKEREQFGMNFPDGNRTVLYPQISLPYVRPGWYVTPRFGVNYRRYSLSGQTAGQDDSISVTLPVFSLDTGMTFERPSRWFGRDYTQTLEPRLYYVNIPYRDQSDIPLFDTALADFNFAQIFSENQFSGWDRVNNANQLTAALTSRLIEPETGGEIIRAMIGQRFHFTRNKVGLNGTTVSGGDDKWDRSDFLAGFSGQILPKVFVDTAWQFDPNDRRSERYSVGMRYQPEPGKVFNVAYRYNRETSSPVNQVDVSGQWPLVGRWHGVGRLNYSFKDDGTVLSTGGQGGRVIESIAGLEYNGGCWILRGVIRRQALTSEDASTSFYVQLELGGLGRIGSNPLTLLKRNIQGYGLIGDNGSESAFGDY
jgi:LPS-assembly protein